MDLREIYNAGFEKFSLGPVAFQLLQKVMSGDDKIIDFENIIEADGFFSKIILTEADKLPHQEPIRSLAQAVGLIGKDKIRNLVLAHSINRVFDAKSDLKFKNIGETNKSVRCANEAENLAKQFSIERPDLGFSAGLLFDVLEQWLINDSDLRKKFSNFFDETWRHSLRTALISTTLSKRLLANNANSRLLYAAALLHDLGKLFLAFTYSEKYQNLLADFSKIQKMRPYDDDLQAEMETEEFGVSHAEIGSLLIWQFSPLKDWEHTIECHHNAGLLVIRSPDLAKIMAIHCVSDRIAVFLETHTEVSESTIHEITADFQNFSFLKHYEILDVLQDLRTKTALL